jgi:hypothetical protein
MDGQLTIDLIYIMPVTVSGRLFIPPLRPACTHLVTVSTVTVIITCQNVLGFWEPVGFGSSGHHAHCLARMQPCMDLHVGV